MNWDFVLVPYARYRLKKHSCEQGYSDLKYDLAEFKRCGAEALRGKSVLWAHGASIGEIKCLKPIINEFLNCSLCEIVFLTYTSPDGLIEIGKSLDKQMERIITCPLPYVEIRRLDKYLSSSKLLLCVIAEKDIWFRIFRAAKMHITPVLNIDGSFDYGGKLIYRCLRYFQYRKAAGCCDVICVGTERDYEKAKTFISEDKLFLTGPSKAIDSFQKSLISNQLKTKYQHLLQLNNKKPVLVAGNLSENEASLIADVLLKMKDKYPNSAMVVAPRHTRKDHVMQAFERELSKVGLKYVNFSSILESQGKLSEDNSKIFLINKTGYLADLYSVADVAIVGGSFYSSGGHNFFEPVAMKVPTICGTGVANWEGVCDMFLRVGGIFKTNAENLFSCVAEILSNPAKASDRCERAFSILSGLSKAAEQNAQIAKNLVG